MDVFENFKNQLKANPKTIVFTEGTDARILSAASKLLAGKILNVLLLGNPEAVKKAAAEGGFDITGAEICDPTSYPEFDAMVAKMVELRKGKMTEEQCRAALSKSNYFGTMLVKMGKADCLLGGATYSTADTVRPALQLIKCKPGIKSVSSCFILMRGDESIAMGDCAINIDYTDTVDKDGNVIELKEDEDAMDTFNLARMDADDDRHRAFSEEAEFQDSGFDIEDAPEDAGADIDVDFDDE